MSNKKLDEIILIRAIACISIVMLHSIKYIIFFDFDEDGLFNHLLLSLAGFLSFGTPAFIFISALLLSYRKKKITLYFLKRKGIYIFLPYILIAVFYAVVNNIEDIRKIPLQIIFNIFGGYHGWFVLVIFQFYLIYNIFVSISKKYKAMNIIYISFIINFLYLFFFSFYSNPFQNELINYFWDTGYILPFVGWIFYFALAFYCGSNYNYFLNYLKEKKYFLIIILPFSILLIVLNNIFGDYDYGSKRWDMLFFTSIFILLLFYSLSKIKKVNFIFDLISRYSFGIYLFHYFAIILIYKILNYLNLDLGYSSILLLFSGSILISISTIYILNKIPYGEFVLGKVNSSSKAK